MPSIVIAGSEKGAAIMRASPKALKRRKIQDEAAKQPRPGSERMAACRARQRVSGFDKYLEREKDITGSDL